MLGYESVGSFNRDINCKQSWGGANAMVTVFFYCQERHIMGSLQSLITIIIREIFQCRVSIT